MLNWEESFKDKFHSSWHLKMQKFIESEECFNIYQELKQCKEMIYPKSPQTWRAFSFPNEIKAIFVGMSPYHTMEQGKPVADGLAFSCGNTNKESPSLKILYNAMEDNLNKKVRRECNLEYLAQQGVLLLNTSLTVKAFKADSHRELWKPFIKYLFTEVLDTVTGIPIVLFGKTAQEDVERWLFPMSQPYLKVNHPAFYARNGEPMEHKKLFTWCNSILHGNNKEQIYWDWNDFDKNYLPF
jgi:uracil-DNA glycosylase